VDVRLEVEIDCAACKQYGDFRAENDAGNGEEDERGAQSALV